LPARVELSSPAPFVRSFATNFVVSWLIFSHFKTRNNYRFEFHLLCTDMQWNFFGYTEKI